MIFEVVLVIMLVAKRVDALYSSTSTCTSFYTTFGHGTVSPNGIFVPVDTSRSSYALLPGGGLELNLQRPSAHISRKGRVNSVVAAGATINSTFLNLYGKYTFEVLAPTVAGVVTAIVLIAPGGDEIDIEILGSERYHWQTNIFAPQPFEKEPLYGIFGGTESFPKSRSPHHSFGIDTFHTYTVDWKPDRITWGVDGKDVRTIMKKETRKNNLLHFPSHAARVQLGIWDASSPEGTSEWAKGPITWSKAPKRITAIIKSMRVEC